MQLSKQVAAPHLTSTESFQDSPLSSWSEAVSINQSQRKTSYANDQTHLCRGRDNGLSQIKAPRPVFGTCRHGCGLEWQHGYEHYYQ